jgi:putative FmdB family regulatory protein
MPTYEYACKGCGEHLEVVQSFKDDALTECPNCHGELRKVFSAAGLIFKGSGWHVKDYASSSRGGGAASRPSSDSSSEAGGTSPSAGASDAGATSSGSGEAKRSGTAKRNGTAEAKSA